MENDQLLTASAAGKLLGIEGVSVSALARRGKLPFVFTRDRRIRLYRLADVQALRRKRGKARAR